MFSKLSVIITSVLATLAAATCPTITPPTSFQCCSKVATFQDPGIMDVVSIFIGTDDPNCLNTLENVPIGLECSPITAIGNPNCGSTMLICDPPEREWDGFLAINCLPATF